MTKSPPKKSGPPRAAKKTSPVCEVTRQIPWPSKLLLAVQAGGHCEFDGCNDYLFEHHVTLREGNFAQLAHIVAFSEWGPRGRMGKRPADIHSIANLMLLCHKCHKQIDDHPDDFSRQALERHKSDHETRIRFLTDLRPDRKTAVVQFKANIRNLKTDLPFQDVVTAVSPRFPASKPGHIIDLTTIRATGKSFYDAARQSIDTEAALLYRSGTETDRIRHLSLFAIGPIPLLAYLGGRLSDKIPVDLFQRHRDTGDWFWKGEGSVVEYATRPLRAGAVPADVAVIISLSGKIDVTALPASIGSSFTVYEITLHGSDPGPDFLRRRDSLEAFRLEYRRFLARVVREHPQAREIQVFPAVPAPIAIAIGLDRLRQVQPQLAIYNHEGPDKGFVKTLNVDDHDTN